jgi:hypothetical protein
MMIDQFVAQLQSTDPNQRRQAIIALGSSKNPAALQHLAQIFRTDPEPELRELARKAGVHIRKAMDSAGAANVAAAKAPQPPAPVRSSDIDVDDPDLDAVLGSITTLPPSVVEVEQEPEPVQPARESAATVHRRAEGRSYEISRANIQRAKEYVEGALSMNMRGANDKAMKMLAQALSLNPNLINDGYFMSIAASITGLEGDGAVQMILDGNQRKGFVEHVQQKKKQERIEKHLSEAQRVTWASTWFEIIIFTLITAVGPVLLALVTAESARALINTLPPEVLETPEMQSALATLSGYTFGSLILVGLTSALGGVISLLVQTVFIHYGAVLVLGGHGTLRYMLELLLGFYNKWLPVIFFLSYITVAVGFISGFSPVVLCLVLPLILLSLYVSGKTSSKIGEAYDFGTAKGCLAYFISIVIIFVITFVLSFVSVQAFGAALQNLLPRL